MQKEEFRMIRTTAAMRRDSLEFLLCSLKEELRPLCDALKRRTEGT